MCALKTALAEVNICGPSGDPKAPPEVSRYTKVPWAIIHAEDEHVRDRETEPGVHRSRTNRWKLGDENAAIRTLLCHWIFSDQTFTISAIVDGADDVFGEVKVDASPHSLRS